MTWRSAFLTWPPALNLTSEEFLMLTLSPVWHGRLASHRGLGIYRKLGEEAYTAYHNGIYRTGHNEGKLTAEDIEKVATAVGAGAASGDDSAASDQMIESNDALAEMLGLTGTPGIIIMPAENATAQNTTVIPGVVSEDVLQQAINRAAGR
ncbi:hypothetical protein C1Y42_22415 [Pantoea sp. ICBG 985]|nr:hypothetical protein C1Y42_22415 [Pantoea sp. ICBG 985]